MQSLTFFIARLEQISNLRFTTYKDNALVNVLHYFQVLICCCYLSMIFQSRVELKKTTRRKKSKVWHILSQHWCAEASRNSQHRQMELFRMRSLILKCSFDTVIFLPFSKLTQSIQLFHFLDSSRRTTLKMFALKFPARNWCSFRFVTVPKLRTELQKAHLKNMQLKSWIKDNVAVHNGKRRHLQLINRKFDTKCVAIDWINCNLWSIWKVQFAVGLK